MAKPSSSRFTPFLFLGVIGFVAVATTSLSLWETSSPPTGYLTPEEVFSVTIDNRSPRPAFKRFGAWYR
ncbi:MAG: hypothetical protein V1926_02980, partial [Candidatus Peregrinibacteria bacterium]